MNFIIKVDQANRELKGIFSSLNKTQIDNLIARAINRTLIHGNAKYKTLIRQNYNLKNADLKGARIAKAKATKLTGSLLLSKTPIGLSRFNPRFDLSSGGIVRSVKVRSTKNGLVQTVTNKRGKAKKGVSVEINKGKRVSIPYAFMIEGKNPVFARGSYERTGSGYSFLQRHKRVTKAGPDLPIERLVSTSVFGMASNPLVKIPIKQDITPFYKQRVQAEVNYALTKRRR